MKQRKQGKIQSLKAGQLAVLQRANSTYTHPLTPLHTISLDLNKLPAPSSTIRYLIGRAYLQAYIDNN